MSWNIVSSSLRDEPPPSPSSVSPIFALTDTLRPARNLLRSRLRSLPSPPCAITASAVSAAMKSLSEASDVPPGLMARNRISSSLKFVGFSTTRTPLERRHSVMPMRLVGRGRGDAPRRRKRLEQRLRVDRIDVRVQRSAARGGDGGRHFRRVRQGRLVFFRRDDRDDAVAIGRPVFRERVDFGERDLGQEPLVQRVLGTRCRESAPLAESS